MRPEIGSAETGIALPDRGVVLPDTGIVLVRRDGPQEALGALQAATSDLEMRRRFSDIPGVWRRALDILLDGGALTEGQVATALAEYRRSGSLASALARTESVTQSELADALARARAARLVSLDPSPVDPVDRKAARRLPLDVARSLGLVIITATGRHGVVAMADAHDESALFEAERLTRLRLFRVAASRDDVEHALARVWTPAGAGRRAATKAPRRASWRRAVVGGLALAICVLLAFALRDVLARYAFSVIALCCGAFFFLYALKYYVASASVMAVALLGDPFSGRARGGAQAADRGAHKEGYRTLRGETLDAAGAVVRDPSPADARLPAEDQPFVSVHLAMYNESRVVDRLLTACTSFDHPSYEVIVVDDSTDETTALLERWKADPRVRVIHRSSREGFKGGALQEALRRMDPRTEYVMIFDADFIPPADAIRHFLDHFGDPRDDDRLAVVQGYQWHMLNASENWITKGIRTEFSGSYVLERAAQELFGTMKMISGSVYMIRADVLRRLGWSTSITEDWELTIRLYLAGHKVLYTPYIQAPAECVSTVRRLIRQRMRWARGHTFNVKRYFFAVLRSPNLTWREKAEFLYYAPYYLQSVLFAFGTCMWLIGTFVLGQKLPMWGEVLGWSLVFSNALALPLMNLAGILLEGSLKRDAAGVLSFIGLSWLLVPFQALASLQGLLQPDEGGWVRTPKSGRVTEALGRFHLARLLSWELPHRPRSGAKLIRIVVTCITALLAGFILAVGTLSMRAAASTGTVAESDLVLPFVLGTLLPLAILGYGWFRLHRRLAICLIAAVVGLSANVVFLAGTIPASATAGLTSTFYLRSSATFGCTDLDMIQSAPTSGTASTLANWKNVTKTFCSDTFTSTMSIATGTVVVTTYWTNANNAACSLTVTLLRDGTSLASAVTTVTKKTTPTAFSTDLPITGFTFADGERLNLRLTGANTNACRDSTLHYDGTAQSSNMVTATIVPEGILGLLLLAPVVPVAIRRRWIRIPPLVGRDTR